MKLFAALERALLARWRKIKAALKVNKWPLLSLKEQQLQLKKQYLESLFKKKWHKFVRSIYDVYRVRFPPCQSQYNTVRLDSCDSRIQWVSAQQGRIWHVRHVRLAICWRSSLYQYHLSLRLTIMCDACDSNNMCGTDKISWQSRVWTAIIKA